MNELVSWIGENSTMVKGVLGAVIGIAAVAFGGWQIIRAMKFFGVDKAKEGGKALMYAILIFVLAGIGIAGVIFLANTLRPDTIQGGNDFAMALSVYSPRFGVL